MATAKTIVYYKDLAIRYFVDYGGSGVTTNPNVDITRDGKIIYDTYQDRAGRTKKKLMEIADEIGFVYNKEWSGPEFGRRLTAYMAQHGYNRPPRQSMPSSQPTPPPPATIPSASEIISSIPPLTPTTNETPKTLVQKLKNFFLHTLIGKCLLAIIIIYIIALVL